MSLLITGGTGFFGRALIRYLDSCMGCTGQRPFERVTILTRNPQGFSARHPVLGNLPWLDWHQGDVLDFASLPHALRFDSILHAAADSTDANALTALQRYRQIVDGTENLLQFAARCGAKRFLLTSSGGAYGPQPPGMDLIPEAWHGMPDPLLPGSVYGVAKRQAEHLCLLYGQQHGFDTVIARCFAFVGEDLPLDAHFAIGNFIRDALQRPALTVQGDGSPLRSYLHQHDLAHWLLTLMARGASGNAYNVGSDHAISIRDLAHLVRDTVAPDKPVHIQGVTDAKQLARNRYLPSIEKISSQLGLRVEIGLQEAILRTAAFHAGQRKP